MQDQSQAHHAQRPWRKVHISSPELESHVSKIKHIDESPKRCCRDSQFPVNTETLGLTIDHRKIEEKRVHEHRENTRDNKQFIAEQESFVLRIKDLLF